MKFLKTMVLGVMLMAPMVAHAENPVDWVRNALQNRAATLPDGSAEAASIKGTLSRIRNLSLPQTGRVIVVNIASGVVTAYEDGNPVIESKAVVGSKATPTPELDNTVTFVRPNPTWTVPQSIIGRKNWRDKLAGDPEFFENSGFDVILDGQTVSAFDAADRAAQVTTFVQRPGENNALGALKIGLSNDQAIYMHDTNDPGKFEDAVRSASAGCIRIEQVRDIAAWVLQVPTGTVNEWISSGDMKNHNPPEPVRVIIGYWTAWPDSGDRIRFYPDIYKKDGGGFVATSEHDTQPAGDLPAWASQVEVEAQEVEQGPRFIPHVEIRPEPIYTERRLQ
jgi:murein L,D-transpeptidase YcbB/YkuD